MEQAEEEKEMNTHTLVIMLGVMLFAYGVGIIR